MKIARLLLLFLGLPLWADTFNVDFTGYLASGNPSLYVTGLPAEFELAYGLTVSEGPSVQLTFAPGDRVSGYIPDLQVADINNTILIGGAFSGLSSATLFNGDSLGIPTTGFFSEVFFPSGLVTAEINGSTNLPSSPAPVPEPSSLLLLGTGMAGIAAGARRKWASRGAHV